MLNKLALALAVLIVVLLAGLAAITISASQNDSAGDVESELISSEESVETSTAVALGTAGEPLDVECQVPLDDNTPLLVSFLNATDVTADYLARVTVDYRDGTSTTAIAEATSLRPGERRTVVPEPWPDDATIVACRLDAIQRGEQVILLDSDR